MGSLTSEQRHSGTNSFASQILESGLRHKATLSNLLIRIAHRESQGNCPTVGFVSASQHRPVLPAVAMSVTTNPRELFTSNSHNSLDSCLHWSFSSYLVQESHPAFLSLSFALTSHVCAIH